jgi:hypothetical protein
MRERRFFVVRGGLCFCMVKGWVKRRELVHVLSLATAEIVQSVHPGSVILEVVSVGRLAEVGGRP